MYCLRSLAFGLFIFGIRDASPALAQNDLQPSRAAREHFAAGVAHIEDPSGPKYEEAYREFKAAYAESSLHTIALDLGYCAFFLERDGEALEMYERYLAKAAESELARPEREQLERDVQALRAGLVRLSLKVTPMNATLIDERIPAKGSAVTNRYPVENGTAQLGIHPGVHKFTIVTKGYRSQSWEFEAQPGSVLSHEFHLTIDTPEISARSVAQSHSAVGEKSTPPMLYVGALATGVLTVGTVVTGLAARSKRHDFDELNDGTQVSKVRELRDAAKTYALVSDICLGTAIVSAGLAAYFYFGDRQPSSNGRTSGWSVTPKVGMSHTGLELWTNF